MKVLSIIIFGISFVFFTTIAILIGKKPLDAPNVGLSISDFCEKHNYTLDTETAVTEDGYILSLHRIKVKKYANLTKKPPVFFMHGLTGSSGDFICGGPGKGLAFQLADKGYDVWLGNQRGNTYSRNHIMLEADLDAAFWDFSYHEIAMYDIPTMIDHVINKTKFSKLTYVGMSQGSLTYFIMTSEKPEYNKKIKVANLLAPVFTFYNTKNYLFWLWDLGNFAIEPLMRIFNINELFNRNHFSTEVLRYICIGPHKIANWFCIHFIGKYFMGLSTNDVDYDILPFTLTLYPSGASVKQFLHFVQGRKSGNFSQYDHYDQNQARYNNPSPPLYDISKSTAPVALYYSRGDELINIEKLYHALKKIPNVILKHKVPDNEFNHGDFIISTKVNDMVYYKLIDLIDEYHRKK
ncbi:lipase 1-like isoform X2 [Sitophilus oryzae]|uniref:Lipase n=1 Tax=Sitophilus oryzae TaxID=7048 RepID=A0A6J2Y9C9_SITOR|nr:lipase 1-like isoform X2 [Sitophilus oryzae]XP_030759842.1 lipase 1-like isoform X2 [Sitophilus oryzae]XP_030759843.1 lipase 1-like isoform X2 [Sitophilus oryzae]XP_030759844.1 lipase 1-like isoform X2 [Sitophilus oryzae]XP_030759845.1 lipase 1-like isoform X2 [Sitophilus oryzae]